MKLSILTCVLLAFAAGCGDGMSSDDAGVTNMDAGGGTVDAGGDPVDSGSTDSGPTASDSGPATPDAGSSLQDAGTSDAGDPGMVCTAEMACTGGAICVGGPSCDTPWDCILSTRPCTDDLVEYCGCDGAVFRDSSTCPTRPFAHMGACAGTAGFNCDRSTITCRAAEPMCPEGQVAEVMGACWTFRCVPLTECGCTDGAECPMGATCDSGAMRCQGG